MQAHMKALMIENGRLLLKQVPVPKIANAEVLLEVEMSGICGTDLELLRGYYDFSGIPGHEFVATVKDGPDLWLNKRVVVDINLGCGDCDNCRLGVNNHCAHRTVIGIKQRAGAFADYLPVPLHNLVRVPDHLSNEHAVFAEPVAAALEIWSK